VDRPAFERKLRAREVNATDALATAVLAELDDVLVLLRRYRPFEEVRDALMARLAAAPLAEFNVLKAMYFRHFNAREH
jgi:hypothetical protein